MSDEPSDKDAEIRAAMIAAMMEGVRQALEGALAEVDLERAIRDGVFKAFDNQVYASEIIHAIGAGTEAAMSKRRR